MKKSLKFQLKIKFMLINHMKKLLKFHMMLQEKILFSKKKSLILMKENYQDIKMLKYYQLKLTMFIKKE